MEQIGEGGFGHVFRAYDPALQRDVALKLRRQRDTVADEELVNEARRLARVRHPNVLVVHGIEADQGLYGLWCDLVAGRTLEDWLRAGHAFSEAGIPSYSI